MALPTFVGVNTRSQGTGAGVALNPAASRASGDIELWAVRTAAAESISLNTANGAALVTGSELDAGGIRITVFWRRWDGAAGNPTLGDSGTLQAERGLAIRGCIATGDPWDFVQTSGQTPATTSGSITGNTTAGADRLIVFLTVADLPAADNSSSTDLSSWTNASLANVTERAESTTSLGALIGLATGELASAGATGTTTFTSATSSEKAHVAIALIPAAAATATTGKLVDGGLIDRSSLVGRSLIHRSMEKINGLWCPDRKILVPVGIQLQGA